MTQPQGELFDIGYRRYEGPREGRWRSRFAIFENGVRTVLGIGRSGKSKLLPAFLFGAAIIPALILVLVASVLGNNAEGVPGPSGYYQIVAPILFIFGAIMAPELLIPDRRERVLNLYLVRPLSVPDYLGARIAAFFVIVLLLVYSGQVVLQIGRLLAAESQVTYIKENWSVIPRFILSGALIALFVTTIPMVAAGFISRSGFATAAVIGVWFVLGAVTGVLAAPTCETVRSSEGRPIQTCDYVLDVEVLKWTNLIDIGSVPLRINDRIFSEEPTAEETFGGLPPIPPLPLIVPVAWYTLLVGGSVALLLWRYRRISP